MAGMAGMAAMVEKGINTFQFEKLSSLCHSDMQLQFYRNPFIRLGGLWYMDASKRTDTQAFITKEAALIDTYNINSFLKVQSFSLISFSKDL